MNFKNSTVTTGSGHGYEVGDVIKITSNDYRWWRRLWYFVTFRRNPQRTVTMRVRSVSNQYFNI